MEKKTLRTRFLIKIWLRSPIGPPVRNAELFINWSLQVQILCVSPLSSSFCFPEISVRLCSDYHLTSFFDHPSPSTNSLDEASSSCFLGPSPATLFFRRRCQSVGRWWVWRESPLTHAAWARGGMRRPQRLELDEAGGWVRHISSAISGFPLPFTAWAIDVRSRGLIIN